LRMPDVVSVSCATSERDWQVMLATPASK
jgi:hypothetical protein